MRTVLIVDPISSGAFLAPAIHKRNYACIALLTHKDIPNAMLASLKESDFLKIFWLKENVQEMIAEIESFLGMAPDFVICGAEPGVIVTDYLSAYWKLPGNSVSTSARRRNKFLMQAALHEAGLACIPSFKHADVDELCNWAAQQKSEHFVLKPVSSLGTDQVFFCNEISQVKEYVQAIVGRKNIIGQFNQEVLIQPYVTGTEYVIDAVSCNGQHYVTDMAMYVKEQVNGSAFIYKQMVFIDSGPYPEIKNYIEDALNALSFQYGPSHSELILTEQGPVLVETGARLHGGLGPKIIEACNSVSLIELTLDAYLDPAAFIRTTQSPPQLKKAALELFLVNKKEGVVSEIYLEEEAQKLANYYAHACLVEVDQKIQKTVDLMSSPGSIVLLGDSFDEVQNDVRQVNHIEEERGFFEIQ